MKLYLAVAYLIGALMASISIACANVYLFNNFDPKFRDALGGAVMIELTIYVPVAVLGAGILRVAGMPFQYQNHIPLKLAAAVALGAGYPVMVYLGAGLASQAVPTQSSAMPIAACAVILCWPILSAFLVKDNDGHKDAP